MAKTRKSDGKGGGFYTRAEIAELNKTSEIHRIHPDDLKEVSTGGFIFANKEAKEKFKKAAININPKTKDEARYVQSVLLEYIKLIEKYPKWVFEAPQEVVDAHKRGLPVKCGVNGWLNKNIEKYEAEKRAKRRAYYLRKKQEKQQNSK